MDLTTAEGVREHMRQSTSYADWDRRCDDVKQANGGQYPTCWYEVVIAPDLQNVVFGSPATVTSTQLHADGTTSHGGTYNAATGNRID